MRMINFKTRICEIFDIEYPILLGGMAWVGTAKLAAAVSNAGGLGIIGAGAMDGEMLRREIERYRTMSDKNFGVNIILLSPYADELVEVVMEEKVPVVSFGAGNPTKYIPKLKEKGIKVISVVSSDSLARLVERSGADVIVAEGMESGGHIGDVTTVVLVRKIVDTVKIPVVAAGGIVDGRGFLAMLALGAEGVQMGTRFVASLECEAHENYKKKILKASIRDTVVTGLKLGHPARVIRNKLTRKVLELEEFGNTEEAEKFLIGTLRKAFEGDVDNGSVMAGQSSGLIEDLKSVKEIMEDIVREAHDTLTELSHKFLGR